MRKITRSGEIERLFVVDLAMLRHLEELFSSQGISEVEATISLSDASEVSGLSLKEVAEYGNLLTRRITALQVRTPFMASPSVSMRFNSRYKTVSFSVEGSDDNVLQIYDRLAEIVRSRTNGFQYFQRMPGWHKFVYYLVLVAAANALLWTVGREDALWAVPAIALLVLAFMYQKIADTLFPHESFAIGDGLARTERNLAQARTVWSTLLGSLLLAVVVGLIANGIYDQLVRSPGG